MSCSTLQAIWPGQKHENVVGYGNSHGTAPVVWGEFCTRYLGVEEYWWLSNYGKRPNQLWDSWRRADIPKGHRAVLLFTCDHLYVKKADYRRFAEDLRGFLASTLISANHVNHWTKIAQFFEMDPDYPAIALWCTSVTSDPFCGEWDDGIDDYGPFDWSRAHDLYLELDAIEAGDK